MLSFDCIFTKFENNESFIEFLTQTIKHIIIRETIPDADTDIETVCLVIKHFNVNTAAIDANVNKHEGSENKPTHDVGSGSVVLVKIVFGQQQFYYLMQ